MFVFFVFNCEFVESFVHFTYGKKKRYLYGHKLLFKSLGLFLK